MSVWIDIVQDGAIALGEHELIDIGDHEVAVFNIDGEYHAIENICTHDGGELASGELENCKIFCPRHGACFDLKTGSALTPPAYEAVNTYQVRVHKGIIQALDPEA